MHLPWGIPVTTPYRRLLALRSGSRAASCPRVYYSLAARTRNTAHMHAASVGAPRRIQPAWGNNGPWVQGGGDSPGADRSAAFSVDRRPLAPCNQDAALRLMGIALGHGEPPKPEDTPPLISAVNTLASRATRLFEGFPQALQRGVQPLCKVRHPPA